MDGILGTVCGFEPLPPRGAPFGIEGGWFPHDYNPELLADRDFTRDLRRKSDLPVTSNSALELYRFLCDNARILAHHGIFHAR